MISPSALQLIVHFLRLISMQSYRVVKYVRANSVLEAIAKAEAEPIHEVFHIHQVPEGFEKEEDKISNTKAVGFMADLEDILENE